MNFQAIDRVEKALVELQKGRIVVLVDDEDRENEGDLVAAAEFCTAETINFMVKHARGLVCLALSPEKVDQLRLPMMVEQNKASRSTAFTVSIEASTGISTGISASDRAHTVRVATSANAKAEDIVSPGHIFPLRAKPCGVLERTGHTEGAVDLARLAGLQPAGVICEVMNDDGTMARMPELQAFAEEHNLLILSIADMVEYRLSHEHMIERVSEQDVQLESGKYWKANLFRSKSDGREFLAMVYGKVDESDSLVRMHTGSVLYDVFGAKHDSRGSIRQALDAIEREGKGVCVFIPGPVDIEADMSLDPEIKKRGKPLGMGEVLRDYGLGAQVLRALGLRKIRLLTNRPRRIAGVDGYGLEVVDQIAF